MKQAKIVALGTVALVAATGCQQPGKAETPPKTADSAEKAAPQTQTKTAPQTARAPMNPLTAEAKAKLYGMTLQDLDGNKVALSDFRSRALLFVNTASQCGYTPQYGGLQRLHKRFGSKGLLVAGFPCNQFGGQEPGTAKEIKTFCETRFSVTFPVFAKVKVNGNDEHPLFKVLKVAKDPSGAAGDVRWNFEKFLVMPEGKGIQRFRSGTRPESAELLAAIQAALPKS